VSGEVLYNGHPVDSFVVERVASYVQQVGDRGRGAPGTL